MNSGKKQSNQVTINLGTVSNSCFVVMPFASLFDREYTQVIKPAVERVGLECVRGDEIYERQSIVQDIWRQIRTCRVVVAELSGRNPNVMYEVGLAHAVGKPIILLTRDEADVPFDLKSLRYVYYGVENPDWGIDLRSELERGLRRVLETADLGAHLEEVSVVTRLPEAPRTSRRPVAETLTYDLCGVWRGSWLSVKKEREHVANLVIPQEHGSDFTASVTVSFRKDSKKTLVEETLRGVLAGKRLALVGVNYTYIQQGASVSYSLDHFDLNVSDAGDSLEGTVALKNGTREILFKRVPAP